MSPSLNLIVATEALGRPLTGIGYYTAHLVERLLASAEIDSLGGVDSQGLHSREALQRLNEAALHQTAPSSRRGSSLRKVMQSLVDVPGFYPTAQKARLAHLGRLLKDCRGQLLHAPDFIAPRHDGPTVVTVHDLSFMHFAHTHPPSRVAWLERMLPETLARAEQVITDTEAIRGELLERGLVTDPQRVTAIHLGVDAGFRPRDPAELTTTLVPLGLRPQEYILATATLEPRKNLVRLIQAYRALPERLAAAFPLVLSGSSGWKQADIEQEIVRIKPPWRLLRTGYTVREQLQALMAGARVFAYPSLYEGFGLPVAEAMACGAPTLTSRGGALEEVAGGACELVDPFAVEDISAGLQRILDDDALARRLGTAGQQRAEGFRWSRCAEETLAVYRRARDGGRRAPFASH